MAISYDEPITFGLRGSARSLNCSGIDFSEDTARSWTTEPVAELDIQLPFGRQDLFLEIEASPFIVPHVVAVQNVFIFMGGLFAGFCALAGHGVRKFPLNRSAITGRTTRLALVMPTAVSPHSLNLGADMRQLGIYLTSITFRSAA